MEADSALCTRIVDHMIRAIAATPVDDNPCKHAMLSRLFPEDVYRRILRNIPDKNAFRPMNLAKFHDANGVSTRDLIELPDIGVKRIAPDQQSLWWAIGTAIMSAEVKSVVFEALAEDLAPVFDCAPAEVNDQDVFVSTALRIETEAYYMAPHFDGLPRVATMLIYLPQDARLDGLGTSLYDYVPKWQRLFRPAHREIRRAPFLPNAGILLLGQQTEGASRLAWLRAGGQGPWRCTSYQSANYVVHGNKGDAPGQTGHHSGA